MQPLYQALRKQPILSAYGIFCFFDIGLFWLTVSAGQEVMTTYTFFAAGQEVMTTYTFFAQFLAAPALTAVLSFLAGRKPGKAARRWALVLLFGAGYSLLWFFTLNAANALLAGTFTPPLPQDFFFGAFVAALGLALGLMARSLKKTK